MHRSLSFFMLVALVALAGGCGGGSSAPGGSVRTYVPAGAPSPQSIAVQFSMFVPDAPARSRAHVRDASVHPRDVSPGTQSVGVVLAAVDGSPVAAQAPVVIDVAAGAPNCTPQSGGRLCTGSVNGAQGNDEFTLTLYAGTGGTGAVLGAATIEAAVQGSGATLNVPVNVAMNAVIASIEVVLAPPALKLGVPGKADAVVRALDASGATVVNASGTVTLQISGGGNSAVSFPGKKSSATVAFNTPQRIVYNGDSNVQNAVTIAANVVGSPAVSASATLMLQSPPTPTPSPTPIGLVPSVYVLNRGSNSGNGATVSVYALSANGNAAPVRLLQLPQTMTAESLAVDTAGQLHVGYAQGEIDTYAFNANGAAKPLSQLKGDPTSGTMLEPVAMAFDASGYLITIGSTNVAGLSGRTAALVYRPNVSGATPPVNAWNFTSPYISVSGSSGSSVAGLAVDANGYFYVDGALASSFLSSTPGIYVAAPGASGNGVNATREIEGTSQTTIPQTTYVGTIAGLGLDAAGNVYESQYGNAQNTLPGQINVFAAGTSGGNVAPLASITGSALNILVGQGVPALPIAVYGSNIYVVNGSTNALLVYATSANGSAAPLQTVSGSSTSLNVPIGIAVGLSGSTQ